MIARYCWLVVFAVPTVAFAQPDPKSIESICSEALKSWDCPGLAIVVVSEDKIILARGFGVRKLGESDKVNEKTLFPLASCTKGFTSALMAKLVDDGQLDWSDPVRKHLPTFRLQDDKADALLEMRDLFSHGSGLAGHDLLWYRAPWDLNEVIRRTKLLPLSGAFRASYHYSSLPYIVAGKAMENRTGESWDALILEKFAKPLDWKTVAFTSGQAGKVENRAWGHEKNAGRIQVMNGYQVKEPNPAGSLHLSANDLGNWIRLQLADGQWNGKPLITPKNFNRTKTPVTPMPMDGEMLSVYPDSHQVSYAMGWVVYDHRGERVIAHGGILDGFRAQITLLPKRKFGFALLNNLHQTRMNIAIANSIIDRVADLKPKDWNGYYQKVEAEEAQAKADAVKRRLANRDTNHQPSFDLKSYSGEYEHEAYGSAKVIAGKPLRIEWSSFSIPLEHWQGDEFRVPSGFFLDELIAFSIRDGKVQGFTLRGIPFARK